MGVRCLETIVRRYHVNDNLHSQFSRTAGPAQRLLKERPPGTVRFGRSEVLGLSSDAALTDFTMGGTVRGVAWSINPYLGCMHACSYCYVPDTMHLERARWGAYVAPKRNLPTVLRRELKVKAPRTVYLSTATDAYQAPEREHQITRRCLELLVQHDWPVDILTRSPLVVRDLDLLRRLSRVRVGLTIPTLDDAARRMVEPQAPPIVARLTALRTLSDAGLTTYANLAPAYPLSGGMTAEGFAEAIRAAGAQWVNESHWKRVPTFLGPLWDRLHKGPWRSLPQFAARPEEQSDLKAQLFEAFRRAGLPIRVGFYNPPFETVGTYEPTSQMRLEVECEGPARPIEQATVAPLLVTVRR